LTPNLDEAATLLGEEIGDLESMRRAGRLLNDRYGVPILLKGGHLGGTQAIDLLFANDEITEFSAPFTRDVQTHGTGCTYAAAITAGLASGCPLSEAVARAKTYLSAAIAEHFRWANASNGAQLHALNHQPATMPTSSR
jgi:hydroxymethylpyrimidine/phosphomethylpyrimidine kinase